MIGERCLELTELFDEAILELEEAMAALIDRKKVDVELKVWRAASDIEYATFILSLFRESDDEGWKEEWNKGGALDLGPTLLTAQDLLKEAREAIKSNSEEAYRRSWAARNHLLKAQERLEK